MCFCPRTSALHLVHRVSWGNVQLQHFLRLPLFPMSCDSFEGTGQILHRLILYSNFSMIVFKIRRGVVGSGEEVRWDRAPLSAHHVMSTNYQWLMTPSMNLTTGLSVFSRLLCCQITLCGIQSLVKVPVSEPITVGSGIVLELEKSSPHLLQGIYSEWWGGRRPQITVPL